MTHQTSAVLIGRMVGIVRLHQIIAKLSNAQISTVGLRLIRRELMCKGSREGVLRYAQEILTSVKEW